MNKNHLVKIDRKTIITKIIKKNIFSSLKNERMILLRRNRKNQLVNYDNSVVKSNEFSMARLSEGLTLNQTQLLIYTIFCTQKNCTTSEFKRVDFEKKFDLVRYQSNQAQKDAKKLVRLSFSTEDLENESFDYQNVFQRIHYEKGIFTFKWTEDMLPHITDLKERYIINDLTITANFRSGFTWKLYDYIKANYGKWYKKISKKGLMRLFNVEAKKSYQNTSVFKKGVLDVAIEEINTYTEYSVSYEDVYEGRSIVGFILKWSVGKLTPVATNEQRDMIKLYVDTIEKDAFQYFMQLEDERELIQMKKIISEITAYKKYIDEDTKISKDDANKILFNMKLLFKNLQELIAPEKPTAPLYDWLKYNSPEEQEAIEAMAEAEKARKEANKAKSEAKRAKGPMLHVAIEKANALEEVAKHLEDYAAKKKSLALEIDKDNPT